MSARAAVGVSNRAGLFENEAPGAPGAEPQPEDEHHKMHEVLGTPRPDEDPLQMEHMIGYAGLYKNTVIAVPNRENTFVKSMGSLVSIENLGDQYDQKFLRGHDMQISALAVSPSGCLIASGQNGTVSYKGNAAPIFVWDTTTQRRVSALRGLTIRVNAVAFSTDERFLCGTGEDCLLFIWELSTGEVVYGQRLASPATVLKWTEHKQEARRVSYELVIGINNTIFRGDLLYDLGRVQWSLQLVPYSMPPGGSIVRCFTDAELSTDRTSIYIGTTGGEVMVYRRGATVFRACIPVCAQGVTAVAVDPSNGELLCGGGDGSISLLEGGDMGWRIKSRTQVDGSVRSMSRITRPNASGQSDDYMVGCATGTVFCCSKVAATGALSTHILQEGHTAAITALAFNTTTAPFSGVEGSTSNFFVTGTASGELRGWDLADYRCIGLSRSPKFGAVLSLIFLDKDHVIVGWGDGSVRCMDFPALSETHWYIATAHRDGCTSIGVALSKSISYMVTGGNDSTVRIWKLNNRELVTQYSEHKKAVTKVLVDVKSPSIVHSCGMDGMVVTFDIKTNKRVTSHMINSGSLMNMTQRFDARSEIELVTCDSQGKILQWDVDVREAVHAIQDPVRKCLRTCCISPSGRFLVFSGDDSFLKVVDIITNQVVSLGQGHSNSVNVLCWTPDERQIISGGADCCLCIWNFYLSEGVGMQATASHK